MGLRSNFTKIDQSINELFSSIYFACKINSNDFNSLLNKFFIWVHNEIDRSISKLLLSKYLVVKRNHNDFNI